MYDGSMLTRRDEGAGRGWIPALALTLVAWAACGEAREPEEEPEFPGCPDGDNLFTHAPVDPSLLEVILPMGSTTGGTYHTLPTPHVYLNVPFERVGALRRPEVTDQPVVAPGDMIITVVRWETREEVDEEGELVAIRDDYSLFARACGDVRTYFYHLNSVSDAILSASGSLKTQEGGECKYDGDGAVRECAARISVPVAGGELIGTVFRPGYVGLDWGVLDERSEAGFLNPARYVPPTNTSPDAYSEPIRAEMRASLSNARCPLDFYADAAIERELTGLLGGVQAYTKSLADPPCGTLNFDLAGTARGHWFAGAETMANDQGRALALVNYYVDPSVPLFSPGWELASVPEDNYTFAVEDAGRVNRRFEDVTPGATHCWHGLLRYHEPSTLAHHGRVLMRLSGEGDAPTLTFEYQEGEDDCGPEDSWEFGPEAWTLSR